jgi:hypothetical protein
MMASSVTVMKKAVKVSRKPTKKHTAAQFAEATAFLEET